MARAVSIARAVGIVYSERCVSLSEALEARPLAEVLNAVRKMQQQQRRQVGPLRRLLDMIIGRGSAVPDSAPLDHAPDAMAAVGLQRKKVRVAHRKALCELMIR
jgi:hypothetical protein